MSRLAIIVFALLAATGSAQEQPAPEDEAYRIYMSILDDPAWNSVSDATMLLFEDGELRFVGNADRWTRRDAEQGLLRAQPLLDRAARAAEYPQCDFAIGPGALDPQLDAVSPGRFRALARALLTDAGRLAVEGDVETSVDRIITVVGIARHLSDEPNAMAAMIAAGVLGMLTTNEGLLQEIVLFPRDQRDRIIAALKTLDRTDPCGYREAWHADALHTLDWIDNDVLPRGGHRKLAARIAETGKTPVQILEWSNQTRAWTGKPTDPAFADTIPRIIQGQKELSRDPGYRRDMAIGARALVEDVYGHWYTDGVSSIDAAIDVADADDSQIIRLALDGAPVFVRLYRRDAWQVRVMVIRLGGEPD